MIEQSDKHLRSATKLVGLVNSMVSPSTGPAHLRLKLVLIATDAVSPAVLTVTVKLHFQMSSS